MSILSRLTLLLVAFSLIFIAVSPVLAAEENKYGSWQSSDDRLKNMINELDQVILEGTSSRAAHPGFLDELNMIINQYRIPTRTVFFSDDFSDSNFTENPTWKVRKGTFYIDRLGSLYSSIPVQKPAVETKTETESDGGNNLRILMDVLDVLTKDENEQQEEEDVAKQERAVISSAASIPNSFTMQFSFKSDSSWGSTRIGVFFGTKLQNGYHLVYRPSPAEKRPLRLIKYNNGKQYVIDQVRENSPDLDDGLDHTVQLIRSPNGDMVVTVDKIEVIRTADYSYRDDFSGVAITNNGGSYSYDNIEIYAEL